MSLAGPVSYNTFIPFGLVYLTYGRGRHPAISTEHQCDCASAPVSTICCLLPLQAVLMTDHSNRVGINECRDLIDLAAFRNWADVVAPPVSAQGFTTPKRRNQDLKNEYEWHRIDLKDSRARLVDELLAYLLLYLSRSDTPNGLPPKKPDEDQDEDDEPGKGQGVGQSWARAIIVE